MRLIFNWEQFNEAKGDKFLMPLYTSTKLYNKLDGIDSPISSKLVELIDDDDTNRFDFTLLDFDDLINDEISFTQTSRIKRAFSLESWKPTEDYSNYRFSDKFTQLYKSGRTSLKIGRFIKKVLPTSSDKDIEAFVNKWKATFSLGSEFKVVNGSDIVKWYNGSTYAEGGGSLNNSCMKNATFLELYEKNIETIQLIILVKDDKLMGRALLWKLLSPEDKYFMDRIYTVNDSDINKFKEYAKSKNYIYKKQQSYGEGFEGYDYSLSVQIESGTYSKYPYMDTLYLYEPSEGILYSNEDMEGRDGFLKLRETNGLAQNTEGWDDWNDRECDPEQLVYCENINGYCDVDDAEWLEYIEEYYAPNGEAIYDEIASQYYKKQDCIEYDNDGEIMMVYKENVVDVIIDDMGNFENIHKGDGRVCKVKMGEDHQFYLKTLCFKSNNQYFLNKDGITIYLRKDVICSVNPPSLNNRYNRFSGAYLTKEDAIKYNKPIYDNKLCKASKEEYEKLKWVGMEDNKNIPESLRKEIEEQITDGHSDSMYYKNTLYNKFGKLENAQTLITDIKLKCIELITDKILQDNLSDDDFIYDNKSKKYKLSVLESNTENNIIMEQDSDGDLVKYLLLTKEDLIEYIKKCYMIMHKFDTSYYNISSKWESVHKCELSYYGNRSISNILDAAMNSDDNLEKTKEILQEYVTILTADLNNLLYPID